MASYKRFEDTPAWQLSQDLALAVFAVTKAECFKFRGDLVNQLRRAALSISNNIAEGFARGTTKDFLNFLYISRGSCAETKSMVYFALRFPEMDVCRAELEALLADCDRLGKQIWGWIDALQNSSIEGMRALDDERREERMREAAEEATPKRMSNAEFGKLIREKGREAALKESSARFDAWCKATPTRSEQLAEMGRMQGAPNCEMCGAPMVLRHSKTGSKFWGCTKYPACTHTLKYQAKGAQ